MNNLLRIVVVLLSSLALTAGVVLAREQPLQFVHALQVNGYPDMAVEYLKLLAKQTDVPQEVRDVWDLEMSKSLKATAGAAFNAKESAALMEESQKHLAKFIKERPDHPEAVTAIASWGEFLMNRALDSLRLAKTLEKTGKEQKGQYEKCLTDARAGLADAREKYRQAEKKFASRLAELPPPSKLPQGRIARTRAAEERQSAEMNLFDAQFQLALIEYYLAQTCSDPSSKDRVAELEKAAKMFDDIFQQNRENDIGRKAHMWHGKTAEELGDLDLAIDIYDEVVANFESSEKTLATGMEPLFAEVERSRFKILAKKNPQQFLSEAWLWLKEYRRWKQTEGYQGIALDVARAALENAEQASGPKRQKIMAEVLQMVAECSKVRSPYQQEFALLRRDLIKKRSSGAEAEVNSFEEAVALGDSFAAGSEWQKALDAYNKSLMIAEKQKLKNAGEIATVREAMSRVQFMIARDLFVKGKLNECIEMAGKIVRDDNGNVKKESAAAAQASALAVTAALNLYATDKKPATLERLMKVAEFTEKNWPDKPEADDARMARGQAKLVVGQIPEAIRVLDRVNPKSERYAVAMYWAGQSYWRLYLAEKTKPEGSIDKARMAADRAKAIHCLSTSLAMLRRQFMLGQPLPNYMLDTQLLLADIHSEGGKILEAAALYQPLVEQVKAEKPQTFDVNTMRILLGVVRAYSVLNDLDKAGEANALLMELGPDTLQVNDSLVQFAKLLNGERKKADAALADLELTAKPDELAAAKTRQVPLQEHLGKLLVKLSQRKELGLGHMIFIGQALNTLGMTDEASRQFQNILKRTESDPEFSKRAEKAMSFIRTELLKALRKQQKYDEALKQVDQYIKENPRALEPFMEKGRILEAWAEKDPSKFNQAVGHWTELRNRLQPMRKKPDEYYDVMYNVAKCLVREAETNADKAVVADRAKKAEQVIKSALVLSPKLNGPDMVAKYKALVNKAIALQGRLPDSAGEK